MKRKIFITAALVCCLSAAFAFFANLTGKWTGVLVAPDGNEYPLNYTFKEDNGVLTGQGDSPQGALMISNGKVKGDSLSFAVDFGGAQIMNSGKYFATGDSISLNVDYQGFKMHTTLKRVAEK